MSQKIPIYIPTYINSAAYAPARVLPRLLFFNGMLECEKYYFESGSLTTAGISMQQFAFPYFDHYNVVSGSFPTTGSKSLLFNNESPVYGSQPTSSLYTEYWDTYISLLYNPRTRVLNASAIIPLADYFKMELNDIVNFRGNYWHLRAINDYSLKTGECNIQLLGPIIPDTFSRAVTPEPTIQTSGSVSWSFTENTQDGQFTLYDDSTSLATLTANGSGNANVTSSHYVTASLTPLNYPSSGSVTMSLSVSSSVYNYSQTVYYNTTLQSIFSASAGVDYAITATTNWQSGSGGGGADFCYTASVVTGTYPVTGGNNNASGSIRNCGTGSLYIYAKYNSGPYSSGDSSGMSYTIDGNSITIPSNTISSSGQDVYSNSYFALPADNTNYNWIIAKNNGLSSGDSLRLVYANSIGGPFTNITTS